MKLEESTRRTEYSRGFRQGRYESKFVEHQTGEKIVRLKSLLLEAVKEAVEGRTDGVINVNYDWIPKVRKELGV